MDHLAGPLLQGELAAAPGGACGVQGQPSAPPGGLVFRDQDGDGQMNFQEFLFAQADRNGDGKLSPEEMTAFQAQRQRGMPVPPVQHGMPPMAEAGAGHIAGAMGGAIAGAAVAAGAGQGSWGHMPTAPGGHAGHGARSALQKLSGMRALQIKERANILEEVSRVAGVELEMANQYDILDGSGILVFKAVETTSLGNRQCQNCRCCGFKDCAALDVEFLHFPPGTQDGHGLPFMKMHKTWQCTCCCIKRPVAYVEDMTANVVGTNFGWFRDPCTCCRLKFNMNVGDQTFIVDGGTPCQSGWCCPMPCGPCASIKFQVDDEGSANVATIERKVTSSWCLGSSLDDYTVEYLSGLTDSTRAMIMALAVFIDFRYFNKSSKPVVPVP